MPSRNLYKYLKTEIDTISVLDSHEHLFLPEEDYLSYEPDFAQFLIEYSLDDLVTAGMPLPDRQEFVESLGGKLLIDGAALSPEEKWAHIKPFWEAAKFTGYGRVVRLSMQKLLGIENLTDDTWLEVNAKLRKLAKPGVFRHILRDVCGFELSLNDVDGLLQPGMFESLDRSLFKFVARFREFTYCYMPGGMETLERMFDRTIRSLSHFEDTLNMQFERWEKEGRIAIKIADAYMRDIHFTDTPRDEAERAFMRIFTLRKASEYPEALSYSEARSLENWIVHRVLERCEERGLPVIIHTGLQAGTGDNPSNSRVTHLYNLFRKFERLKFHILHSNYPWMGEAAALCKQFPNVSLDLTWVHMIVPAGARQGLAEILDAVPRNKIHCFGGDMVTPLSCWGALEVARENIVHVLADKVEIGHMSETDAVETANMLLNGNVKQVFGL
jgi:predicted TIM-barrel fold metal-dependent hydrolase